jgi:hypothetical protein
MGIAVTGIRLSNSRFLSLRTLIRLSLRLRWSFATLSYRAGTLR